jgi:hypothetical protein
LKIFHPHPPFHSSFLQDADVAAVAVISNRMARPTRSKVSLDSNFAAVQYFPVQTRTSKESAITSWKIRHCMRPCGGGKNRV